MGKDTVKSLIFAVALFEFLILWVLIFTSSTNSIQFYLHLLFMNIKPWKKFHRTRFKWLNNWIGPQELKWFQIKVLPNNLQVPLTFFHITEGLLEDLVSPLGPVLLFLQLLQLDGHATNIGQSIILQPKQQSGQFCLIILQRKITFIFFVLADALFLWDLTVYTHPFSLCSSKLLYEISEGHSDCLWVYVESVNFSSPVKPDRWCTARHAMRATTSLRGTSPRDGASTTLSGGGICVLKSYTNNAKKIKSPFSNYSMSCMSEFKISNLKKLRPVLDHKT